MRHPQPLRQSVPAVLLRGFLPMARFLPAPAPAPEKAGIGALFARVLCGRHGVSLRALMDAVPERGLDLGARLEGPADFERLDDGAGKLGSDVAGKPEA